MFSRSLWIVALFWLNLISGASAAPGQPPSADGIQHITSAQRSWSTQVSPPVAGDANWQANINLPDDTMSQSGTASQQQALPQAWYRAAFDAPNSSLAAVYIPRACTNLTVWINDQLIGTGGSMQEPLTRNCYYPQLFTLPSTVLKPSGNTLYVRLAGYPENEVAARQRQTGLSDIQIGEESVLRPRYEQRYFWSITITQIIGITLALMGMIFLMLAAGRRQDRHLLYFGLTLLGWSALGIRLYWQDIPLPGWVSEILIVSLFPPVLAAAVLFLLHFVKQARLWVSYFLLLQCLLVPLLMLALGRAWIFKSGSSVFTLLAAEFLLALVYAGWHAWRTMRTDFWIVGSALLVAGLMAAGEIAIQNDWIALPRIHLIHFGMPLVFTAVTARLAQQFSRALTRSEHISAELEIRVAEKAREIEQSYEQISKLRITEAASLERQRIASDLHDDLGARLLSLAQSPTQDPQAAHMARQALDDMRLSVRGLTAEPASASQVIADWRSETMERLQTAGLQADWQANEPPQDIQLGARLQVQLTRILREAISNLIRHAKAHKAFVELEFSPQHLTLRVHDDGQGLPVLQAERSTAPLGSGHGLLNIERRAHHLGGVHHFGRSPMGGTLVEVRVPLHHDSQPMPLN